MFNDLFTNLLIHHDSGSAVNLTTNGTTGTVNAYTGVFDPSVSTTSSMTPTMKEWYDTELLENARPSLKYNQLGMQQFLPENHGDVVEWRKWNTIEKALKPLQEGVIPKGKPFGMTSTSVKLEQYGDYIAISDRLEMHAVDKALQGATEELGVAGGWTADTLTRNTLMTGTSVIFADTLDANGVPTSTPVGRYQLVAENNRLTPDSINKAVTFLKKQRAPFFEGNKYVAVIHPSVTYDLRSNKDWLDVHRYDATREIFEGEIGELHGVRFIENNEAPIMVGENLFSDEQRYLSYSAYSDSDTTGSSDFGVTSAYKVTVSETLTDAIAEALVGRKVHIYDASETAFVGTWTIVGATVTGGYIWVDKAKPASLTFASGDLFYPGEGGGSTSACAVYATMFFGKDAFAVVDPEGMGMRMIIKDKSQAGGPLEQFSTVGYKFETAAKILYQNRMVRVESCSAYSTIDEEN